MGPQTFLAGFFAGYSQSKVNYILFGRGLNMDYRLIQCPTRSPDTRSNSRRLFVTGIKPAGRA